MKDGEVRSFLDKEGPRGGLEVATSQFPYYRNWLEITIFWVIGFTQYVLPVLVVGWLLWSCPP
jgi:hypothetical protein